MPSPPRRIADGAPVRDGGDRRRPTPTATPPANPRTHARPSRTASPPGLLESVTDLGEQPALRRCHLFAPLGGKLAQKLLLFLGELGGYIDDHRDDEVASAPSLHVGHAPAPQPDLPSGGCAHPEGDLLGAVEG